MKIGLVSCAKLKRKVPCEAKKLYISTLFNKALEYSQKNYDRTYILSAKYVLLNPNDIVKPYELTLKEQSDSYIKLWSYNIIKQLEKNHNIKEDVFYFHCGTYYRKYLKLKLIHKNPLLGLRIGKQLKFYKDYEKSNCIA